MSAIIQGLLILIEVKFNIISTQHFSSSLRLGVWQIHWALKWMSLQLEMSSSCPSCLDASVISGGLGSLGDHMMDSSGLSVYVE